MKPILDSTFALPSDGFCQVMPFGEFTNALLEPDPSEPGKQRRREVVQVCDRESAAAVIEAFNRAAGQPEFTGLLVDRDHESCDPDKTTDAWGWCMALENRADGLWCKIRWTDIGAPAVSGGRFRFLSPVFDLASCQNLGNGRLRPTVLKKLALTNEPNLRTLKALTNRADEAPAPADAGKNSPGSSGRKESTMDFKAELLAMLGLPAEATDEQVSAACAAKKQELANCASVAQDRDQLKNRAEASEAKVLVFERQALEAQVETDLETHKDVIANREEVKAQLLANREPALKILAAMRKPEAPKDAPPALRNRATKEPGAATLDNRAEQQKGLVNSIRERERGAGRKVSWDRAWEIARTEKPELFAEPKQ
jgi:phage I-like protein